MASARIYWGWFVLGGLFLIYAATNGILMHTLPLIYPELIDEFGWSEADVTWPATVLFIVAALTSPPAGALLDRYSPRLIILTGVVVMAFALAAFSRVDTLWQLVAVYVVLALALSVSGLVSNMVVLTRWFEKNRGRATGILLMASSAGGTVFPLVLGATMNAQGWRTAVFIFAFILAAMTIIPLLLFVRDRPSDVGQTIDARPAEPPAAAGVKPGMTLRQAVQQREFYLIAFATAAVWFSIIAMTQHQSIYLGRDIGVDREILPRVFSVFFACSVIGKFTFGWLSDRFDKCNTMNASILVFIAGLLLLRFVDVAGDLSLFGFAVVAGIGFSGAFTSIQLLIARFYAGQSYGKILAILVLMDTLAGAAGTRVVGMMRTALGSYLPAIDLMLAACITAIVCVFIVKRGRAYQLGDALVQNR